MLRSMDAGKIIGRQDSIYGRIEVVKDGRKVSKNHKYYREEQSVLQGHDFRLMNVKP